MTEATKEPADAAEKDSPTPGLFKAVEAVTKGLEVSLPGGRTFMDKDGLVRRRVRIRWWADDAVTLRSAALLSPQECEVFPHSPLPDYARVETGDVPVIFGHYWMTGSPSLASPLRTCVDYSAGAGGPLVAYRFDGEPMLLPERLVWVD